jgi:hypothetical protein
MPGFRIFVALILAPAVFPLGAYVYSLVQSPTESSVASVAAFMVPALFTYPTTFLLGLPTFLIFRTLHWQRWWQYALGGAVIGAIIAVAIAALSLPFGTDASSFLMAFPFACIGFVSAVVFWLILNLRLPMQRHVA